MKRRIAALAFSLVILLSTSVASAQLFVEVEKSVEPKIVKAGEELTVKIVVRNEGLLRDIYEVEIEDEVPRAFELVEGEARAYKPILEAGDSFTHTYRLRALIAGTFTLPATHVVYEGRLGVKYDRWSNEVTVQVLPWLTVDVEPESVQPCESVCVKGVAYLTCDVVDIVIIGPEVKGTSNSVADGLLIVKTQVANNKFERDFHIPEEAMAGTYHVMALAPGRDGYYGDGERECGELYQWLLDCYDRNGNNVLDEFVGKSADQILELIKDVTVREAGSDDLRAETTFEVEVVLAELSVHPKECELSADQGSEVNFSITIEETSGRAPLRNVRFVEVLTLTLPPPIPSDWISFDKQGFDVPAGGSKTVKCKIRVPEDAEPREYSSIFSVGADNAEPESISISLTVNPPSPTPTPTTTPTPTPPPVLTPTPMPTTTPTSTPTPTPTPTLEYLSIEIFPKTASVKSGETINYTVKLDWTPKGWEGEMKVKVTVSALGFNRTYEYQIPVSKYMEPPIETTIPVTIPENIPPLTSKCKMVVEAGGKTASDEVSLSVEVPGFGVASTALGLLAVAYFVRWRRERE